MTYKKYNVADDVISQLEAPISASTTTINVKTGQGTQFPATNSILKIVQYNTADDIYSGVSKSENVLLTSKSGDTLTVERGYNGTTGTAFNTDDYLYLTNTSEVIKDIQAETSRLETAKLNKGGLRTALNNAWKMFFSNGSKNETEISLGSSNQVLTSNGSTSNPSFKNQNTNIGVLSEDTTGDMDNDYLVRDKSGNKKIKVNKYRATTSDITSGAENKFITPKQLNDNKKVVIKEVDIPYGSGDIVFTHNLGKIPQNVRIIITNDDNNYAMSFTELVYNGTNYNGFGVCNRDTNFGHSSTFHITNSVGSSERTNGYIVEPTTTTLKIQVSNASVGGSGKKAILRFILS